MSFFPTRDYLCNEWISRIPIHRWRMAAYRFLGLRIGLHSTLLMGVGIHSARELLIGNNSIVNQDVYLDARGGLTIGDNVNISPQVTIVAGTHDVQSEMFEGFVKPVVISDFVWLCTRSTILPGVCIGEGAVVASGAVVTRDVSAYSIVAGVPARKVGERKRDLRYHLTYDVSWV